MGESNPKKMEWLQVLRAVAALAVLLFHAQASHLLPDWSILQKISAQGFFGVDIFFCLSGYVICVTCERRKQDLLSGLKFIAERFSRIYLGYWPVLFLTWLLSWSKIQLIDQLEENSIKSFFLLSTNLSHNWLPVAWSLAFEVRFYLIVLAIYFILKFKISFTNILLASLPILGYGLYFYSFRLEQVVAGIWPLRDALSAYSLEFCFGVYVYKLNQLQKIKLESVMYLAVPALLLIASGTYNHFFADYELLRAGTYGVASMIFLMIFIGIQNSNQKANKIMVAIGDSSYSLYLLHWLMLPMIVRFYGIYPNATKISTVPLLILIVVFSYFWYISIEKRLYKSVKNIIFSRPRQE